MSNIPTSSELKASLLLAADFVAQQGDKGLANRLSKLAASRDLADMATGALSEATGGAGSLFDRHFCRANGDKVTVSNERVVNDRFRELVTDVERQARRILGTAAGR